MEAVCGKAQSGVKGQRSTYPGESPDAEGRLHGEAQKGTGIPGEDVADLGPLVGLQQSPIGRVLNAVPKVDQTPHQDLDIYTGPQETAGYFLLKFWYKLL